MVVVRRPGLTALVCLVLLMVVAGRPANAAAVQEKRVALVIGNAAYASIGALANPVRDARAISRKLRLLGFDTIEATDADDVGMKKAIREFAARLDGADVGLFYYAGHGIQLDGANYLLSVNAEIAVEDDVHYGSTAIAIDEFLKPLDDKARIKVVILDACRNNPFVAELQRSMGGRSVAVGQGLARLEPGRNRLIAYSTEPGNTASDGAGENSPFTAALVRNIDKPGVSFGDMMADVTSEVAATTNRAQVPSVVQSLTERFYMVPPVAPQTDPVAVAPATGPAAAVAAAAPAAAPAPVDTAGEDAVWQMVQGSENPDDLDYYLTVYPNGRYRAAALFRKEKLQARSQPAPAQSHAPTQMAALPAAPAPAASRATDPYDLSIPGSPETEAMFGREERREIQGRLTSISFDTSGVDGSFGPRSRRAIVDWQASVGAVPTGYMTPQQLAKLRMMSDGPYRDFTARQRAAAEARRQEAARRPPQQQPRQSGGGGLDPAAAGLIGGIIGGVIGGAIGR